MKKLLLLSTVLLGLAFSAQAQITRFVYIPVLEGGTNNIINLASNTYSTVFSVENQDNVAISVTAPLIVSNFWKPRLDFQTTVDGLCWSSTNLIVVSCLGGLSTNDLAQGMTCYTTNLDVRGLRAIKFIRLANTDYHGIATNLTIGYGIKR